MVIHVDPVSPPVGCCPKKREPRVVSIGAVWVRIPERLGEFGLGMTKPGAGQDDAINGKPGVSCNLSGNPSSRHCPTRSREAQPQTDWNILGRREAAGGHAHFLKDSFAFLLGNSKLQIELSVRLG